MHGNIININKASTTAYMDLTQSDLKFINRHAKRIARFLRNKYMPLGWDRDFHKRLFVPELRVGPGETPNLTMRFMRLQQDRELKSEAILSIDMSVIKPRNEKELSLFGLTRDPDVRERQLVLHANITRPNMEQEIVLPEQRMGTAPSTASWLFDQMLQASLIEHPDYPYYPLEGGDRAVMPKLQASRSEKRSAGKESVAILEPAQRGFVRLAVEKFQENFTRRYGHVFDHIDFKANTVEKTFCLTLHANTQFAGHRPFVELQGKIDLIWRNEGGHATSADFKIEKGLLAQKFASATDLFVPINILKRREASIDLFNMLSLAGRIQTDPVSEWLAVERRRAERLHPRTRRAIHRHTRRQDRQVMAQMILRNI